MGGRRNTTHLQQLGLARASSRKDKVLSVPSPRTFLDCFILSWNNEERAVTPLDKNMFERFRGAIQEQAMRFQYRELFGALGNIDDPARADLEHAGIDADKLQRLVAECGSFLSDAEKQKIVAVANRPEIKERLPQLLRDQKLPVPELPSKEQLARVFKKELTDAELQTAEDIFIEAIAHGDIKVFAASKRSHGPRSFLSEEDAHILLDDDLELKGQLITNQAHGECPVVYPELVKGYQRTKELFRRDAYRKLMVSNPTPFGNRDSVLRRHGTDAVEKLRTYMVREALPGHQAAFITMTRDVYMPTKRDYQTALPKSNAKIGTTVEGVRLYQEVPTNLEPYKCIEVDIHRELPSYIDPRPANLRILIVLGPTQKIHDMLRNPTDEVDDFGYEDTLRAFRKDPGFFVKAIRKAVPHMFDMIPHTEGKPYKPEEDYFPDNLPDSDLVMHLDVPELREVGMPEKIPFKRMGR